MQLQPVCICTDNLQTALYGFAGWLERYRGSCRDTDRSHIFVDCTSRSSNKNCNLQSQLLSSEGGTRTGRAQIETAISSGSGKQATDLNDCDLQTDASQAVFGSEAHELVGDGREPAVPEIV